MDGKVTDECKGSEGTYTLSNAGIITLKYTKQVIEGALKDSDETETAALKDNKITFPPEKKWWWRNRIYKTVAINKSYIT